MDATAIITGGSGGIGAATARLFAQAGMGVVIGYNRSKAEALRLAQEISQGGGSALAMEVDVTNRAQVQAMVEQTVAIFGGVDVLVNNAGTAQQKLFTDITAEDWNQMLGVNLTGVFHCCQCVLPHMIHQKAGSIVNVSSIWGIQGASCEAHYSAAKAGVIGLTKALAQEVGPSGIRVNCVAPGVIDTAMNAALDEETRRELCEQTPLGIMGSAEDVANAILFLASAGARFITGQVISPNGGMVL